MCTDRWTGHRRATFGHFRGVPESSLRHIRRVLNVLTQATQVFMKFNVLCRLTVLSLCLLTACDSAEPDGQAHLHEAQANGVAFSTDGDLYNLDGGFEIGDSMPRSHVDASPVVECSDGDALLDGECVDVDECTGDTLVCSENTVCTNVAGGFECGCVLGFESVNGACVVVDECAADPSPCDVYATRTNVDDGFECS